MAEPGARARGAVVAGAGLFVLGFAVFFTLIGGAFGALGAALAAQRESLGRIGGVLPPTCSPSILGLGLFLLGVWRPRRLERKRRAVGLVRRGGLLAAFPLGMVFGAGWTPCIGPTQTAILTLSTVGQDASAARGAVLAFAYAVGLGLPFLAGRWRCAAALARCGCSAGAASWSSGSAGPCSWRSASC
jgi:cytochrome c-type biogenesis protein